MTRTRLFLLAVVGFLIWASFAVLLLQAHAGPPTTPPGNSGNNPGSPGDDCSHGNSDKPCRPDPQPTHGQDCDDHGNAAGNEDHCLNVSVTPTPPPSTPPTVSPTISPTVSPTEAPSPGSDEPVKQCEGNGSDRPKCNPPIVSGISPSGEVAFTGSNDAVPLAAGALLMFLLGLGLIRASKVVQR